MRYSILIPAYNEERYIADTLASIHNACQEGGIDDYEVIVADDHSTDQTAALAQQNGARVVESGKRNIAASRNAAARAAQGEFFIFIDADTRIHAALLQGVQEALANPTVMGGGAVVAWSGPATPWSNFCRKVWNLISRTAKLPAGSFFFLRREGFENTGGFDERYFITEELDFGKRLQKEGKLVILTQPVYTSPRKVHQFSPRELLQFAWAFVSSPQKTVTDRSRLDIWYERREG